MECLSLKQTRVTQSNKNMDSLDRLAEVLIKYVKINKLLTESIKYKRTLVCQQLPSTKDREEG